MDDSEIQYFIDHMEFPVFVMYSNKTEVVMRKPLQPFERFLEDIRTHFGITEKTRWLRVRWFQAHGSTRITEDNTSAVMQMLQANVGSGCVEINVVE